MMGRLGTLRVALPGAVVLTVIVVFLIALATQPGTGPTAAVGTQSAAVTSITRSCPPTASGSSAQHISAVAVPAKSGSAAKPSTVTPGSATFSSLLNAPVKSTSGAARKAAASDAVSAPGRPATLDTAGNAFAVAATGQMAEGFEAEQTDASGTGLVSCSHPSSDLWFVGTGTSAGAAQVWLYLVNTGNIAANVDVTILTDTGQQNGLSNAIAVAPGQYVKENVTPDVSGSQALALHVQTAVGQVAASVWEAGSAGGGAWLPQAAAPSTAQVIPGLTVASSSARLFVVVPGSTDAQLKIVAYTSSGAVTQFPSTPVDASAGATTPVTLSSLGASATGLKLTSSVPIVAGVLVPGAGMGGFTTGESPLTEQGVVAGNPVTRGVTVGVLLTAPSAAATVSISEISDDGTVTTPATDQAVKVTAGHTLAVVVSRPPGTKQTFAIVVTPAMGSGPVYAARVVTSGTGGITGSLTALLPVSSALTSISLPAASNSYTAVLP